MKGKDDIPFDCPQEFLNAVQVVVQQALLCKVLANKFAKDFGKGRAEFLLDSIQAGQFDSLLPKIQETLDELVDDKRAEEFAQFMKEHLN